MKVYETCNFYGSKLAPDVCNRCQGMSCPQSCKTRDSTIVNSIPTANAINKKEQIQNAIHNIRR